jgi:acetate kinase
LRRAGKNLASLKSRMRINIMNNTMKILVLNSGSSSLKYRLFDMSNEKALFSGHIDGIGLERCVLKVKRDGKNSEQKVKVADHVDAVMLALKSLKDNKVIKSYSDISIVGHRVVHGGEDYSNPVIIDEAVQKKISELCELAPLHNPANLAGIIACGKMLPRIPQAAVFDTAFHQTIPKINFIYGLPIEFYKKHKIRRYGFHGPSHKYVSERAISLLGINNSRIITCHLGNGASVSAIKNSVSIATSMGFTPLEGLIMGTRSGNLDPAIPLHLAKVKGYSWNELDDVFNKKSGLLGLSGITSDVRDLHKLSVRGNKNAKFALDVFVNRVAFYIGGYTALLNGIDAIVFTAGIGEGGWFVRRDVCKYLEYLGVKIDEKANKRCDIIISSPLSKVKVYVIPTNEELEIARETASLLKKK